MNEIFSTISKFTYGTLWLGKPGSDPLTDKKLVDAAMEEDLWFHASRDFQEGRSFDILEEVFKKSTKRPHVILRVRSDNPQILQHDIEEALHRFKLDAVDVAQLFTESDDHEQFVQDFIDGGAVSMMCKKMLNEGKVRSYAMETFTSFSDSSIKAFEKGIFKAFVFFYNLIERQTNNELFDILENSEDASILALRPMGSLFHDPLVVNMLDSVTQTHVVTYDKRAIDKILAKSECRSFLELSMRFLLSQKICKTIIGGTSSLKHFDEYITYANQFCPLEENLIKEIKDLHRMWYK